MEKLSMCRICLVENVRMFVVSNKNLQGIYETLTNIPLVTEDRRPILACYFCYSKLKQCCRFKRKCLEAEELFAQMLYSSEEPFTSQGNSGYMGGLVKTPVKTISIVDGGLAEGGATEVEVPIVPAKPADNQMQCEFIEVKIEQNELEPEDVPARHSRTDSEDDVPLFRIKTEDRNKNLEQKRPQVSRNVRRAGDTQDRAPVAKKLILQDDTTSRKLKKIVLSDAKIQIGAPVRKNHKLEDTFTAEQKNTEKQGSNIFQTTSNLTIKPVYNLAELFTKTKRESNYRINKNAPTCKISNTDELKFKISENLAADSSSSSKEKPFKCDMCHRSYNVKSHLTDHKRKHTGEKPFECDICHRCFAISSHLKSHIRTHTGAAKPFKCDICQRSFTLKNNLRTHVLVHTGEKPYKCHICQRAFTQKIHLRSHIPIHTGDRPFKCNVCDRSFSLKHSLIRHIQVHNKYGTGKKSDRATKSTKSEGSQTSILINKSP